jgi:DNA-binding MarR family transcriptional regulator
MTPDAQNDDLQVLSEIDRAVHEPARLMVLACLAAVQNADFLFVATQTGLSRGNLSSHMSRLEEEGYVAVEKKFVDRMPRTLLSLTKSGREAYRCYKRNMLKVLRSLPD